CVAHPQANGRGEVTRALGDFFVQPFKGLLHTGVPAECCTLFTPGRAPVDDPDGLSVAISFEQDPTTAHDCQGSTDDDQSARRLEQRTDGLLALTGNNLTKIDDGRFELIRATIQTLHHCE